jgi:hypothetical protein
MQTRRAVAVIVLSLCLFTPAVHAAETRSSDLPSFRAAEIRDPASRDHWFRRLPPILRFVARALEELVGPKP